MKTVKVETFLIIIVLVVYYLNDDDYNVFYLLTSRILEVIMFRANACSLLNHIITLCNR